MESKTEIVFLKVAGLYLDSVERKGDEVYVGGRRERRLNGSKILILAGVDLEKIMQVIYYNFLIYTKKPRTKSALFSICCVISLFWKLVFVTLHMHVLGFCSSLFLHLSHSSWWRNNLLCLNFPVTFLGKDCFISNSNWSFLLLWLCLGFFSYNKLLPTKTAPLMLNKLNFFWSFEYSYEGCKIGWFNFISCLP